MKSGGCGRHVETGPRRQLDLDDDGTAPTERDETPARRHGEGAVAEVDTRILGYADVRGAIRVAGTHLDDRVFAVCRDHVHDTADDLDGGRDRLRGRVYRHVLSSVVSVVSEPSR